MMGKLVFPAGVQHQPFFLRGNGHRFGEDVHAIEADAGDVLETGGSVYAGLAERAIDDAEFHRGNGRVSQYGKITKTTLRQSRKPNNRKSHSKETKTD